MNQNKLIATPATQEQPISVPSQQKETAFWQALAAASTLPLQMVLANCSLQAQQGELALQHHQLTSQERIAASQGHTQQVVAAEGTAQASSQAFNHAVEVREEADAKKVGHIAKAATAAAVAWAGASAAKSMAGGAAAAKSAATATAAVTGSTAVAASRLGGSSGRGSIREDSPFTSTLRRAAGAAVPGVTYAALGRSPAAQVAGQAVRAGLFYDNSANPPVIYNDSTSFTMPPTNVLRAKLMELIPDPHMQNFIIPRLLDTFAEQKKTIGGIQLGVERCFAEYLENFSGHPESVKQVIRFQAESIKKSIIDYLKTEGIDDERFMMQERVIQHLI